MKILVVDDEAVARDAICEIVEAVDARPLPAEDGQAAWDRLDAGESVAMVISDIRMPRMDGLALLARLRADRRFEHLPVMLVSSVSDRAIVHNAVRTGVQGFLLKPVTLDAVDRVRHVLDQFRGSLLDRSGEAMDRLGVDEERFGTYVDALVQQGESLSQRADSALSGHDELALAELVGSVHSLRMAAVTMGARRLDQVLGTVELGLRGYTARERAAVPQAMELLRLNLYWLRCVRRPAAMLA